MANSHNNHNNNNNNNLSGGGGVNDQAISVVVVDGMSNKPGGSKSANKKKRHHMSTLSLLECEPSTSSGITHRTKPDKKTKLKPHGRSNACRLLNAARHRRDPEGDESEEAAGAQTQLVISPHNDRILSSAKKGAKNKITHGWSWKGAPFEGNVFINVSACTFSWSAY